MRTFRIENFGCRASQADGAALETLLETRGMQIASQRSPADLIVLNTCTVTARADVDARAAIRRLHREDPEARILVTGCYAQRAPQEVAALPGVTWVVGNTHKAEIADLVSSTEYHGGIYRADAFSPHTFLTAPAVEALTDRARPVLKIQDGCNNRCSFCIIPSVRGASRFLPVTWIERQIHDLSQNYREVVLTGINLGRWGREPGSVERLPDLLRRLLDHTPIERIRLSSVEPMDWSDDLLELMAANPRIAPHVHIPLQSGADAILRQMHRKYRPRHYQDRVDKARRLMPDAAIGADVMTGFPGETDALFEESRAFVEAMPFTYLHVFTFSERAGTKAATLPSAVPMDVRRERNRILRDIGERRHREFRQRMRGRTLSAVTLEQSPQALTGNYIRVELNAWPGANQMVYPRVAELSATGMREHNPFPII